MARTAVKPENREKLYARTRAILRENLPLVREWVAGFGGKLTFNQPEAGAICLVGYRSELSSFEICDRIRKNQDTLIVPGSHFGLEGHPRL